MIFFQFLDKRRPARLPIGIALVASARLQWVRIWLKKSFVRSLFG